MKQQYKLFFLALFFTATGFLLGRTFAPESALDQLASNGQPKSILRTDNKIESLPHTNNNEVSPVQITVQQSPKPDAREIAKNECVPAPAQVMDPNDRAEIDKISTLLREQNTNELRLKTFNNMFETNPRTPELDADSAITLNDFFRNDKSLENFIPQQVTCHSNLCKVDLPAIDKSDINELMENLSKQLGDKKLKASHVLLAEDTSQGSIQLYVSLLTPEIQNTPTQRQ